MTVTITLLLLVLALASEARAQGSLAAEHPLLLSRAELFESLEWPSALEDPAVELDEGVLGHLANGRIGLRPVIRLLPAEGEEGKEAKPPAFALVARAEGRTLVAVTRPVAATASRDGVILQRLLVSDLLKGRRFSLTVYKDQAFHENTFRFLGVGARLLARPGVNLFGWQLSWQLFASYHPDFGGTGYLTVSGSPGGQPVGPDEPVQ